MEVNERCAGVNIEETREVTVTKIMVPDYSEAMENAINTRRNILAKSKEYKLNAECNNIFDQIECYIVNLFAPLFDDEGGLLLSKPYNYGYYTLYRKGKFDVYGNAEHYYQTKLAGSEFDIFVYMDRIELPYTLYKNNDVSSRDLSMCYLSKIAENWPESKRVLNEAVENAINEEAKLYNKDLEVSQRQYNAIKNFEL